MAACPACSKPTPADSSFCPSCGSDLRAGEAVTRTSVAGSARPSGSTPVGTSQAGLGRLASSDTLTDARFLPGVMIAGRYRIIGLLGKGGMGEVYRADDLTLGQPVALKFLPPELAEDAGRLQRFLGEVRIARQVSHANVCRVYDIGEFEGQHFISMEFVDGEDLGSLLRRVGRFAEDRAAQMSRQICAGLAAAHAKGIVHRDLKPANVMIDGQGQVRITDFGLAGLADGFEGAEIRVGTPAYMAPEQLTGKEVTLRSDIYSLGLVLYELFTGRPAFDAKSLPELIRQHQEELPSSPTTLVPNLDPAAERAILRCLEKDATLRPGSALAVAAALPGADALAAALEAGETPSPEMVANAGEIGGLAPGWGFACLAVVLLGMATLVVLSPKAIFASYFPDSKPPIALKVEAHNLLREIGYADPPADSAFGLMVNGDYLSHVREHDDSADRWESIGTVQPSPLYFWYRQGPEPLVPLRHRGSATPANPPLTNSGEASLRSDTTGRLLDFVAVPPQQAAVRDPPAEPDWQPLFRAAGLDPAVLTAATPEWNPLVDCDVRRAWTGAYAGQPGVPIRVEAGGFAGQATYFTVVAPWTRARRMAEDAGPGAAGRVASVMTVILITCVVVAALLVARRNIVKGRGDRRSAFRLAAYVFALILGSWALSVHHVASLEEVGMLVSAIQVALYMSAVAFVFYLAVEPFVRRTWPQTMISWSRLLTGRVRDPLVGRDLLIGSCAGVVLAVAITLSNLVPTWMDRPGPPPSTGPVAILDAPKMVLAQMLGVQPGGMLAPIGVFMLILVLRVLTGLFTRSVYPAVGIVFVVMTVLQGLGQSQITLLGWVLAAAIWALLIGVILRLGFLAATFTFVYANMLLSLPLTADTSAWYAGRAWTGIAVLAAFAGFGFYVSLAGRKVFHAPLLDEA